MSMEAPLEAPSSQRINRFLGTALGIFWLLDGLLQLQPRMFSADFVTNVLAVNLSGQPGFMHALIDTGIKIFSYNIPVANLIAALLQLAIGLLLLAPLGSKKFRIGLYASLTWAIIIWIFAEGAGNLFTGSASFYTGAPGSALIYAIISGLLLMPTSIIEMSARNLARITAIILLLGAALQLQPMYWSSMGPQMTFQLSTSDNVHWINDLPTLLSNALTNHAFGLNWFLILIPVVFAVSLLIRPNRLTAYATIVFLLLVWWFGQDFGSLSTLWVGTTTDPNTAPLLIMMMLPSLLHT